MNAHRGLFKFPIDLDVQEQVLEFRTHSRRSVVIGTASALAVTALPQVIAAQSSTPAGGATPAAADGQFPVTIKHIYGETTI